MRVVALAGGVGAGKFLRGLVRVIDPGDLTVVVNTGDDLTLHGLRICPDLDSVMYWLAGVADRDRGWGRAGESFRALDELRRLGGEAWFSLGDLDLATHMTRTHLTGEGLPLSEVTARLAATFGVVARILPMTDDTVATWIHGITDDGLEVDEPFQVYWVQHRAARDVKGVRYEGALAAAPAPGVLDAIADADAVLFCPSNPVVSIGPILAIPPIREALAARADHAAGVTPIVAGSPIGGMADRLMPAVGMEVSAAGAASGYRGLLSGFVVDERDADVARRVERDLEMRVRTTDTLMTDDEAAERVARVALELATV